jgi:hypothetical protein
MFFDELDERNAMLQSILTFEKVGKVDEAGSSWVNPRKAVFFVQAPNVMIQVCFLAILTIEILWRSPLLCTLDNFGCQHSSCPQEILTMEYLLEYVG